MRQRLEYALAWPFIKILSLLPRPLSRAAAISLGWMVYLLHARLRRVGMRNLAMALPEKSRREHARILRGEFTSLGRQLAEVCQFPRYTTTNGPLPAARECCFLPRTLAVGSFPPLSIRCMATPCTWWCGTLTTCISID